MIMLEPGFPPASAPPPLDPGEIHVWKWDLEPPDEVLQRLRALMTEDEQARADRFVFEVHRRRFTAGRGTLRRILGLYLEMRPEALRFQYETKGKPVLEAGIGDGRLRFNLSHSERTALLGVTLEVDLGVDIEHLRQLTDATAIARRNFSPSENLVYHAVPPGRQIEAFFNAWTRKEAFIKATGDGLSYGLDRFDVTLAPGDPARLLRIDGSTATAAGWEMAALEPGPGYVGALAIPGTGWRVRTLAWVG